MKQQTRRYEPKKDGCEEPHTCEVGCEEPIKLQGVRNTIN